MPDSSAESVCNTIVHVPVEWHVSEPYPTSAGIDGINSAATSVFLRAPPININPAVSISGTLPNESYIEKTPLAGNRLYLPMFSTIQFVQSVDTNSEICYIKIPSYIPLSVRGLSVSCLMIKM